MTNTEPKQIWRGVVRKREYNPRSIEAAAEILYALAGNNHTGPVTVNFSQGGVRNIVAEDRSELPS